MYWFIFQITSFSSSLSISCRKKSVVDILFQLSLVWESFISSSFLKDMFSQYNTLGSRFFFLFRTVKIPYHSLLVCKFPAKMSIVKMTDTPVCFFPNTILRLFSLSFTFELMTIYLVLGSLGWGLPDLWLLIFF